MAKAQPSCGGSINHTGVVRSNASSVRKSDKDEAYYLWFDNDFSKPEWQWKNMQVSPPEFGDSAVIEMAELAYTGKGNGFWFEQDALAIYQQLADDFDWNLSKTSEHFGEVRLIEYESGGVTTYNFHPYLGVYQAIGGDK